MAVDLGPVIKTQEIIGGTTRAVLDEAKNVFDVAKKIDAKPPTDLKPVLDALAKLKKTPPKVDFKPLLEAMVKHFAEQAKTLASLQEDKKSHSMLWATPSALMH